MLVAAHTSAGKTVVAEYAFAMALRSVADAALVCTSLHHFGMELRGCDS